MTTIIKCDCGHFENVKSITKQLGRNNCRNCTRKFNKKLTKLLSKILIN